MNSISSAHVTEARTRLLALVVAVSMLFVSVTVQIKHAAIPPCAIVHKAHELEERSRAAIRFGIRLYRFYRISCKQPALQKQDTI